MRNLLLLAFFLPVSVFSQNINTNCVLPMTYQLGALQVAAPSLQIAPDARASGIGDAGLGLSPDANSLYWNAATVGFSEKRTEISMSYSPWFRQLIDGIHHFHSSAYLRFGKRHAIGGSVQYFQAGAIEPFTQGGIKESAFQLSYALRVSKKSSVGISTKFIHSDADAGFFSPCAGEVQPGNAFAMDLSYRFRGNEWAIGKMKGRWNWGLTLSNMGNKMQYTQANRAFLPANLRLGTSFDLKFNPKHQLTIVVNTNKLMVPTPPATDGLGNIVSGMDNNVGSLVGMIHSFYDAPGQITTTPSGAHVASGQKKEEFREWRWNTGFEYNFDNILFARTGLAIEHYSKGYRNYITYGIGAQWKFLSVDLSYLQAFIRTNPLNRTLRLTASFKLPGNNTSESSMNPPRFE